MATLYEMTLQATALYEMLQAEMIDEKTFNDTLEGMGANEKVEGYCQIIKQLQSDVDMFKGEIDRLTARKKTAENAIDRMKNALLLFMEQTGQEKVKGGSFSVSTAFTQAVQITDEKAIPLNWLVDQQPKIDKAGIKKALKEGAEIAGAELITNKGVRIR